MLLGDGMFWIGTSSLAVCKGNLRDTAGPVVLKACLQPICHCGSIPLIRPCAILMDFDSRGSPHIKIQAPMDKTA